MGRVLSLALGLFCWMLSVTQAGSAQVNAIQVSLDQVCPFQLGNVQSCSSQVGNGEIGPAIIIMIIHPGRPCRDTAGASL